jgi:inner membrane protein
MPSPVGHSIAGAVVYQLAPTIKGLKPWQVFGLYVGVANAADLDFVPGLIEGHPDRFHHLASHSIGAALFVALVLSAALGRFEEKRFGRHFALMFGLYLSHLILDWLCVDKGPPEGVPLFWPVTNAYFISPFLVFSDIHRVNSSGGFFPSLFSPHNLWAVALECLVLVPFLLLAIAWRRRTVEAA